MSDERQNVFFAKRKGMRGDVNKKKTYSSFGMVVKAKNLKADV